jgi:D-alanyl-D-alanine carboxypeptidase/D-alanyl-D-alanine-endopeptidase (penicillin-binding protein 4)
MAPRSFFPIYGNIVRYKTDKNNLIVAIPDYFTKLTYIKVENDKSNSVLRDNKRNFFTFNRAKTQDVFERIQLSKQILEISFLPEIQLIESLLSDTLQKREISYAYTSPGVQYSFPPRKIQNPIIIHSQPTDSLLKPMMHRSDNFFAEQSLLMVSNEMMGVMNDEKIIDTLLKTDFKDLPQKPRWADGSGLSRYNLFTPQDFVFILNKMKNEFGMERLKVILPTGGEGTISNYYKADSGYIYGKTGTLSGVVAFSGFLYTKKGKLLVFSALVNNHQSSATEVRKAVEKFLQGVRNKY